jgi:hypothetical protein
LYELDSDGGRKSHRKPKPLDGLAFGQSSALLALMAIGESGYMQLFITSQWQQ